MMIPSLFDNPIFIKHVRSRLRTQQLWPFIVIVVILCFCTCWIAIGPGDEGSFRLGYTLLLILQGLILFLLGSAQVAGSISQARESGMMDFHRISPLRPSTLVAGFLFGAPIREYLLFACTLPFLAIFMVLGMIYEVSFGGMLAVLIVMLVAAVFYHLLSLIIGLVAPKPRGTNALTMLMIIILHALFAMPVVSCLTFIPTAVTVFDHTQNMFQDDNLFFGSQWPIAIVILLHLLPLIFFLLLAAIRKMRNERAFTFSKPMAVSFFAVLTVLIVGDLFPATKIDGHFNINDYWFHISAMIYTLSALAIFFSVEVTPRVGDFFKGIRHAKNIGLRRLSIWHDYSANWWPLIIISIIILLVAFICLLPAQYQPNLLSGFMKSAFIAACAVIFFGAAKQAFDMLFAKNSLPYFALLIFSLWILPLLMGMVALFVSDGSTESIINSFSPIYAIATPAMEYFYHETAHAVVIIPMVITPLLALAAIILSSYALKRAAKSAELAEVTVKNAR